MIRIFIALECAFIAFFDCFITAYKLNLSIKDQINIHFNWNVIRVKKDKNAIS